MFVAGDVFIIMFGLLLHVAALSPWQLFALVPVLLLRYLWPNIKLEPPLVVQANVFTAIFAGTVLVLLTKLRPTYQGTVLRPLMFVIELIVISCLMESAFQFVWMPLLNGVDGALIYLFERSPLLGEFGEWLSNRSEYLASFTVASIGYIIYLLSAKWLSFDDKFDEPKRASIKNTFILSTYPVPGQSKISMRR